MIDIKRLRNDFENVKGLIEKRGGSLDLNNFEQLDKQRRDLIIRAEDLKSKQNETSRDLPKLKLTLNQSDLQKLMEDMKSISSQVKDLDAKIKLLDDELETMLLNIPNIPHESVTVGQDSDDNIEIRKHGTPTEFTFAPKSHWDIGESLGIIDSNRAGKTTGSRFVFYKNLGAKLERALINFMLDVHTKKHGYSEVFPPFIVHRRSMLGTGQLPKFEEDAFKLEGTDYFLVPTAEVPVTNMYREEILDAECLPIKHCAYSACFRAEAGSAGRDTRGLIRLHQFNKVELVKFCRPEDSYTELEKLTDDAEDILRLLKLPYRTVKLCTGDLGFCSAMTYDIEVWMPSYNRYVEISSCSNFEDYQARRANIKFKTDMKAKAQFVHTLNGSGLAVGRTLAAILENYQQSDGTVAIPEALEQYFN